MTDDLLVPIALVGLMVLLALAGLMVWAGDRYSPPHTTPRRRRRGRWLSRDPYRLDHELKHRP